MFVFLATTFLVLLVPAITSAQSSNYMPMDLIADVVELPDPCDNPTTRRWGPDDELGNLKTG